MAATMLRAPQSGRQQAQDGRFALAGAVALRVALPAFAAAVLGLLWGSRAGFCKFGPVLRLEAAGRSSALQDRGLPQ